MHWILSPSFLKGLWWGNDKFGENSCRKALDVTNTWEHENQNLAYEIVSSKVVNKKIYIHTCVLVTFLKDIYNWELLILNPYFAADIAS